MHFIFSQGITISLPEENMLTNRGILRLMQEVAGIHSSTLGYGVNDVSKTRYRLDYFKLEA